MSKVFVSSTYRDLRSCRKEVEEAVRLLGHQDVVMEHYAAEPRPPLHKVLKDVEMCDVYVGIFGGATVGCPQARRNRSPSRSTGKQYELEG